MSTRRSVVSFPMMPVAPGEDSLFHIPIIMAPPRPFISGGKILGFSMDPAEGRKLREKYEHPGPGMHVYVTGPDQELDIIEPPGGNKGDLKRRELIECIGNQCGTRTPLIDLLAELQGRGEREIRLAQLLSTVFVCHSVRMRKGFKERFASAKSPEEFLAQWQDPAMTTLEAFKPLSRDFVPGNWRRMDTFDWSSWFILWQVLAPGRDPGHGLGWIDMEGPIIRLICQEMSATDRSFSWAVALFGAGNEACEEGESPLRVFRGEDAFRDSHAALEAARVIGDETNGD